MLLIIWLSIVYRNYYYMSIGLQNIFEIFQIKILKSFEIENNSIFYCQVAMPFEIDLCVWLVVLCPYGGHRAGRGMGVSRLSSRKNKKDLSFKNI